MKKLAFRRILSNVISSETLLIAKRQKTDCIGRNVGVATYFYITADGFLQPGAFSIHDPKLVEQII